MPGNPINYTINHRASLFPDVQRNFMWNLLIPGVSTLAPTATFDMEDLLVRCRTVSLPARTTEMIQSSFMGTQQYFPGRVTAGGTFTAEFEDTEDMAIASIFYEWQQAIFNINPNSLLTAGKSQRPRKVGLAGGTDGYSLPIALSLIRYDGTPLDRIVTFHNAWVQNVAEVGLSFEGNEAVRYSVTFQFVYWTISPDTTAI